MTDTDTAAAIKALTHRLSVRDAAVRDGREPEDAEVFAAEFLTAMRGYGWRPTNARSFTPPKPALAPGETGPSETTRAELEAVKRRCEALNAAAKAAS